MFASLEASPSGRFDAVLTLARRRQLPTLKVAGTHAIRVRWPIAMRLPSNPNPRAALMYLLWHLALVWSSLYVTSCVGPLGHSLQFPPTLQPLPSVFLSYLRCLATLIPKAVSALVASELCNWLKKWKMSLAPPSWAQGISVLHMEIWKKARRIADEMIIKAQKQWVQSKNPLRTYQDGDLVWLEGHNLHLDQPVAKLSPKHHGPFKVTQVLSPITYQLNYHPSGKSMMCSILTCWPLIMKQTFMDLTLHNPLQISSMERRNTKSKRS